MRDICACESISSTPPPLHPLCGIFNMHFLPSLPHERVYNIVLFAFNYTHPSVVYILKTHTDTLQCIEYKCTSNIIMHMHVWE